MPNSEAVTKGMAKYRGVPMEVFVNPNTKKIAAVITVPNPSNPSKPYRISGSSTVMAGDTYNESFGIILAKKRAYRNMKRATVRAYEKIKSDIDKKLNLAKSELVLTEGKIVHQLKHVYPDYEPRQKPVKKDKRVLTK